MKLRTAMEHAPMNYKKIQSKNNFAINTGTNVPSEKYQPTKKKESNAR